MKKNSTRIFHFNYYTFHFSRFTFHFSISYILYILLKQKDVRLSQCYLREHLRARCQCASPSLCVNTSLTGASMCPISPCWDRI